MTVVTGVQVQAGVQGHVQGQRELREGEAVELDNLCKALARYNGLRGHVVPPPPVALAGEGQDANRPATAETDSSCDELVWVKLADAVRELPIACPRRCVSGCRSGTVGASAGSTVTSTAAGLPRPTAAGSG